jgi:hypothetical protein
LEQLGRKILTLEKANEGGSGAMEGELSRFIFCLQWDCVDDEINSLYSLNVEFLDNVLDSSGFGSYVQRLEGDDEDEELQYEGDLLLNTEEGYFDLLCSKVRFETISGKFVGEFVNQNNLTWSAIRTHMMQIRQHDAQEFTDIPVQLSLVGFNIFDEDKSVRLDTADFSGKFVSQMEMHATKNSGVGAFLDYYAIEISLLKANQLSVAISNWFATELLLTQRVINLSEGPSAMDAYTIEFSEVDFEWEAPADLNHMVSYHRIELPTEVFWFTPVPKNIYRKNSDWWYLMEFAREYEEKHGLAGEKFNAFAFAATMNALRAFLEDASEKDNWALGDFYARHSEPLNEMTDLMRESSADWSANLSLQGSHAEVISKIEMPSTAADIWNDYLATIGRG